MFLRAQPYLLFIPALLVAHFLFAPLDMITGRGFAIDSLTRISPNDSYLGTYYFWWTNLTYLPFFFFTVLYAAVIPLSRHGFRGAVIFSPLLLLVYAAELVDYLPLNAPELVSHYGAYGANALLTNTLNRYHPLVFYTSVVLLLATLLDTRNGVQSRVSFVWASARSNSPLLWVLLINLTALWMGSWWALQEGTWGGWWNWDSSEMFGLEITFIALAFLHSRCCLLARVKHYAKNVLSATILLLSYFFLQLNFDLVSHNFGSKFFFFFNNNLFFLELLASLSVISFLTVRGVVGLSTQRLALRGYRDAPSPGPTSAIRLLTGLVFIIWTLWSYRPLFNYFLWNFAALNVLNSEFSLQPLNLTLATVLLLWLVRVQRGSSYLLATVAIWSPNWLWVLALGAGGTTAFRLLHTLLLLFTLLNISLYDSTLVTWVAESEDSFLFNAESIQIPNLPTYSLDSFTIEASSLWYSTTSPELTSWNLYAGSNAPSINFFSLGFSHASFQNFYQLGAPYALISVYLELPSVGALNSLFWFSAFLMYYFSFSRDNSKVW